MDQQIRKETVSRFIQFYGNIFVSRQFSMDLERDKGNYQKVFEFSLQKKMWSEALNSALALQKISERIGELSARRNMWFRLKEALENEKEEGLCGEVFTKTLYYLGLASREYDSKFALDCYQKVLKRVKNKNLLYYQTQRALNDSLFMQGKFLSYREILLGLQQLREEEKDSREIDIEIKICEANELIYLSYSNQFEKCREKYLILEEFFQQHRRYLPGIRNFYTVSLFYQGRWKEALDMYGETLSISSQVGYGDLRHYGIALSGMAEIFALQGKMVLAEQKFKECIHIFEEVIQSKEQMASTILRFVMTVYTPQGKWKKTNQYFSRFEGRELAEILLIRLEVQFLSQEIPPEIIVRRLDEIESNFSEASKGFFWSLKALCLLRLNKPKQAKEIAQKGIAKYRNDGMIYYEMVTLCLFTIALVQNGEIQKQKKLI